VTMSSDAQEGLNHPTGAIQENDTQNPQIVESFTVKNDIPSQEILDQLPEWKKMWWLWQMSKKLDKIGVDRSGKSKS